MCGQTHPTFHPTFVFSMLEEMLDAFDQGVRFQLATIRKLRNASKIANEISKNLFSFYTLAALAS